MWSVKLRPPKPYQIREGSLVCSTFLTCFCNLHRKCPGKNASIVTRGTPSHPNRPDCPRQLRMISQTAGQRPGRANADLRPLTWAFRAGGRRAEFTFKKPRIFSRAGWTVLTATRFFHGHFFYRPHSPHFFRQILSGRLDRKTKKQKFIGFFRAPGFRAEFFFQKPQFSHGQGGPYSPRLIFTTGIFLQPTQTTFFSTNSLGLAGPGKKNLNPKMALHPYGDIRK